MLSLCSTLCAGRDLDLAQVEHAVSQLIDPGIPAEAKANFLVALRDKGESAREIAAFARSMLARAIDPQLDPARLPGPMLDVCGTGGDQLHLFNVSTSAMLVLAAGGACVVKHGNRAITSKCGGADVLEELGVRIELPPERLRDGLERHGLGFVFAPAYHPAFKAIAPIRRDLAARGVATVFNLLGPLLNPACPPYQLIGIFSPVLLPKYAEALAEFGRARAWAVHGSGMDELSLCGPTEVREIAGGRITDHRVDPREFGLELCEISELRGGDCAENARILLGIVEGTERGPKRDLVLLNAAAGFVITGIAPDLGAGLELARKQIVDGRARAKLDALRSLS